MKFQCFQDFDAFAGSVRGADSTMLLQNPTRLTWSISHLDLCGIHIQLGQEGSGNITEGKSRSNGYILFIPLNHAGAHAANGTALDKNSFAILEPGCDFCLRCKTEHDWCSIFVPSHKIATTSELVESSSGSEKMRCLVSRPNPELVAQFRALVGPIMTTAVNYSEFESAPAARCAAAELRKSLLWFLGRNKRVSLSLKGDRSFRERKSSVVLKTC